MHLPTRHERPQAVSRVDSGQANFGAGGRSGAVYQWLRAPQEEEKFLDGKRRVFFRVGEGSDTDGVY